MFARILLTLALLASSVSAAEVAVLVDESKPGTYLLTVGADGSVAVNPIRVVRPGGSPTNPTDPLPPSDPVAASALALTNTALAQGGSTATAAKLAVVYSVVGDQVRTKNLPLASIGPALKSLTDSSIPASEVEAWKGWRTGIGDMITTRTATVDQATATLASVHAGTKQAVDGAATLAGQAIDWTKLFEMLLPFLLKLLEKWLLGPAVM